MRGPVAIYLLASLSACGGGESSPDGGMPDATPPPPSPPAPYVDHAGPLFEPDHIVDVSITLSAADWDELRGQTRSFNSVIEGECLAGPQPSPFTTYSGQITVDGTSLMNVGIKKKGFFGSLNPIKPSLKIDFDEHAKQDYLGLEKLTLNNANQDDAYVRQCLAYHTFARAGVVVPRCNFARVRVNGADLGIYVNVETIDHRLTRRTFKMGNGTLYEGTLSDFRPSWVNTFDPKGDGDRSDLQPLVDTLATATDAELIDALTPHLDVDRFLTYWAMEVLTAHWDGYANNLNNFFVYNDPQSGQIQFIPWGVDAPFQLGSTFGGLGATKGPIAVAASGVLAHRLFAIPKARDMFLARQRSLLTSAWNEPEMLAEIDRMEALIAPIADSQQGPGWHAAVAGVRDFVTTRRGILTAALDAGPTWDAPLKEYPCLDIAARVNGSFATTWGTIGTADPLGTGSGSFQLKLAGAASPTALTPVGASAGLDPNAAPGTTPAVVLQIFGQRASDGHIIDQVIAVPQGAFFPRLANIGFFDAYGQVYDYNPTTGMTTLVGFNLGTLTLTQTSMTSGGAVAGTWEANADVQGKPPAK